MPYQPAVLGTARLNNFRLNYLTPALAFERPARVWIILGGVDVSRARPLLLRARARSGVRCAEYLRDHVLWPDADRSANRSKSGSIATRRTLLFGGELQTVDKTYDEKATIVMIPCTGIDDTARANRRRPLGLVDEHVGDDDRAVADQHIRAGVLVGRRRAGSAGDYGQFRRVGSRDERVSDRNREVDRRLLVLREQNAVSVSLRHRDRRPIRLTTRRDGSWPIRRSPGRSINPRSRTRVMGRARARDLAATVDPTVTIVPIDEVDDV